MGQRPCCRSCRHCAPPSGAEFGWCQLRQLPIHPDLVAELWCHHWTARPPRLPVMGSARASTVATPATTNRQLDLDAVLRSE
ncbi:MAG: hypothetical protein VKL97_04765 [Cyanobacteriota bacterium]|jgi:hypothetical protein|nr:hypothetical protein [Cyanobacteriota bacterium]